MRPDARDQAKARLMAIEQERRAIFGWFPDLRERNGATRRQRPLRLPMRGTRAQGLSGRLAAR